MYPIKRSMDQLDRIERCCLEMEEKRNDKNLFSSQAHQYVSFDWTEEHQSIPSDR